GPYAGSWIDWTTSLGSSSANTPRAGRKSRQRAASSFMTLSDRSSWHTTIRGLHLTDERRVCRLGLASRGNTNLAVADVHLAIERGVNFLNWCGTPNPFARAIAELGPRRPEVVVCAQFEARTAKDARLELQHILRELRTDYVDILTFYYVEQAEQW